MKTVFLSLCSLLLPSLLIAQEKTESAAMQNRFAFSLHGQLNKTAGNLFMSPYSISSAMAMAYAGARGTTARQMENVMFFKGGQALFHSEFARLSQEINSRNTKDVRISVANRIFGEQHYTFLPAFLQGLKQNYNAPLEKMDFRKEPEKSRLRINAWVEQETRQKIKNLLKPGVIQNNTRMVLVNAIYFYADWEKQFDSSLTRKEDFWCDEQKKTKADLMQQKQYFEYLENNDLQAIRLPYKGKTMSMEIFLPRSKNGLNQLKEKLSYDYYQACTGQFKMEEVKLSLPRFKMTCELSLGKTLATMGMPEAFSGQANFSGMSAAKDLQIDQVIHKAFIDVSEKGTEAAAATAVVMMTTSVGEHEARKPPKIFKADHPFFFIIRDNASGTILFMGAVLNPGK